MDFYVLSISIKALRLYLAPYGVNDLTPEQFVSGVSSTTMSKEKFLLAKAKLPPPT